MATIVNNPAPSERVIEVSRSGDSTGGWVVAVIILIAIIAGMFLWVRYYRAPAAAPAQAPGATVNLTLPSTGGGGGTDTGGGSGNSGGTTY